ncbi:MAG: quinol:electron acceptor oxidoreductase subunit ActD [Burkholderiales bacterium]
MKHAVYGIVQTAAQAEIVVSRLKEAGFTANDISVLFPDKQGTKDFAHEKNTKAPEGATTGGVAGMGIGAALGWLAGIGSLAIPGVGPFIAAGPIMAALSGAAVGGATGGVLGALVGMGIPEFEAKLYDGKVRGGNALVSIHTENGDEQKRAKEILEKAGAEDVSSSTEATAKS